MRFSHSMIEVVMETTFEGQQLQARATVDPLLWDECKEYVYSDLRRTLAEGIMEELDVNITVQTL